MKRRSFIKGAAAAATAIGMPNITLAQNQRVLKFIPETDLALLDPHASTADVSRNHALMVFDQLFGLDKDLKPAPQMLEGHTVENDGKLWKLKLRDGLRWHDGERVTAKDCVASINRWAKRDSLGSAMIASTDELSAVDDKTIQFRLKRPFPLLPMALAKAPGPICVMMPERIANTDAFTPINEMVGSGPYRFIANERVPGARNVYARNEQYKPREDAPAWTSGGKVVHFDRVEWSTLPDAGTCASAIQTGEQDWWQIVAHDLTGLLKKSNKVRLTVNNPLGNCQIIRLNCLHPPFDNPRIRAALIKAIDQSQFMRAVVNDDDSLWSPYAVFTPGTALASKVGLENLTGEKDLGPIKAEIAAAGYKGEPVVLIIASDYITMKTGGEIAADIMKRCGLNVEIAMSDFASMLRRRAKKEPVQEGGWSAFCTAFSGLDFTTPVTHLPLRGNGNTSTAWPGWYTSEKMERLRDSFFDAATPEAQKAICDQIQTLVLQDAPYLPTGQYRNYTALRSDLTGMIVGMPVFWNIRRSS